MFKIIAIVLAGVIGYTLGSTMENTGLALLLSFIVGCSLGYAGAVIDDEIGI